MTANAPCPARPRTLAQVRACPHERRRADESPATLDRLIESIPLGHRDWKRIVKAIVRRNNAQHAAKRKAVSNKTMYEREVFYFAFFRDLRSETPFRHIEPRRLAARHVEAMVELWESRGLGAGTIANYLSHLRTWCRWTERPADTVRDLVHYFGDDSPLARRRLAAEHDHSWIAAGIDFRKVLPRIEALCPYVALQLEFSRHFAARPKEARCLRPHEAVIERAAADPTDVQPGCRATHCLRFCEGTKGGRPRDVPIVSDEQRELIRRACAAVQPGEHLGRPGFSLKANTAHYYRVLAKVGITREHAGVSAHGLRHEFAGEAYEKRAGAPPPVRGGVAPDRESDRQARLEVARLLGHGRAQIASCYLGLQRAGGAVKVDLLRDDKARGKRP
jgi:integrase